MPLARHDYVTKALIWVRMLFETRFHPIVMVPSSSLPGRVNSFPCSASELCSYCSVYLTWLYCTYRVYLKMFGKFQEP